LSAGRPTVVAWLLSVGALVLGLMYVYALLVSRLPTESELIVVEGTPYAAEVVEIPQKYGKVSYVVNFKLGEHELGWSDDDPRYHHLVGVLKRGVHVKAWLSTVGGGAFVPASRRRQKMYQLEVDGSILITYAEVIQREREQGKIGPWVCGFLVILGGAGLAGCIRQQRNYKPRRRRRRREEYDDEY
jgi:hypothetical protein